MQRTFIVGCPRSGTTLVQALLARHPDVYSFPETAFFEALLGGLESRWHDTEPRRDVRWYHRRGIAHARGRRYLRDLETQLHNAETGAPPHLVRACVRRYLDLLDRTAATHGCTTWVEKTPNHLVYVDDIARHVPEARFIHVLRNGEDVVASIVDADITQPTRAFRGGVKRWVRRWNYAVGVQVSYLADARHHGICLEDMVENFDHEWQRLCAFLGLDTSASLSAQPKCPIADLREEPWKASSVSGHVQPPMHKAERVFGPRIRDWVQSSLLPYEAIRAKIAHGG
jgi:Sulfotransferase family